MVEVAKGESGLQQWHKDGSLVKGRVDPRDSGLFQINSGHWDAEAKRLGLDYKNNIEDNVKMARHIANTQGITAWVYYTDHLAQR